MTDTPQQPQREQQFGSPDIARHVEASARPHPPAPEQETPITFEMMEEYGKRTAHTATLKAYEKVIALIRSREADAENPKGWLWKQPNLIEAIESLRQSTTAGDVQPK